MNNGAKYAAFRTYDVTTSTPSVCFTTAVQNMVAYGDPNPSGTPTPVAPGLSPSSVFVTVTMANGVPAEMTVGITSYQLNAVFATITLTNKPQATYSYLGRYAPGQGCTP